MKFNTAGANLRAGFLGLERLQSALLVLLILLFGAVAEYLALQEQRRTDAQQVRDTVESAAQLRSLLEMELNAPLQLSQGLVAHVQALEGNTSARDFQMLLPNLVRQGKHIRNMGVAPGNRLTYLYPLAGNEAAVGLYYPDLTGQWPDIELTIRSRKARLSGPLQLAQGGRGFVYRIPVYLSDGRYWGIVSTVLNVDDIWRLLKQKAQELDVGVAVRHLNEGQQGQDGQDGQDGEVLLGELQHFGPPAALLALNVAGSDWQLAVWPLQPAVSLAVWFRLVGWCTALLLVLLLANVFRANRRWQQTSRAFEQSEKYYRTVLDNVDDAIVVLNPAGQIHTFNQAAEQMFGYQARQLRGLPFQILFPQPPALEPGQGPQELTAQRLHGETLQVELLHTRIELQDQPLQVLLFRDITARKRMDRLKAEFVSTVSHELRTPLTAINGALALVTAGAVGALLPAQQQMLDIARSNADQLMRLVSDILDMEKLQAGKLSLQLEQQQVLPLLQQAVQRHSALALSCKVQLELSAAIPPDLQLTLDGGRLLQVLGNLLSNAIRFSPPHSTVELRAVLSGQMLQLMVSDQGPGVPPDFVPHLFDKFSQADSSDSRQQGGSGLGLAICKELLERLGGHIYYQQPVQGGACFYCEIPLQSSAWAEKQQENM